MKKYEPFDYDEYHDKLDWPYYLALIAFAIVMALVVSDYVWGAEAVTNTIINSIFKEQYDTRFRFC